MKESTRIIRVQDNEGRGPYRPGVSALWLDPCRDDSWRIPFFLEFGMGVIREANFRSANYGEACGCGFRTMEQLRKWFSAIKIQRMKSLGYQIVELDADRILAESERQLVFSRKIPLRKNVRVIE